MNNHNSFNSKPNPSNKKTSASTLESNLFNLLPRVQVLSLTIYLFLSVITFFGFNICWLIMTFYSLKQLPTDHLSGLYFVTLLLTYLASFFLTLQTLFIPEYPIDSSALLILIITLWGLLAVGTMKLAKLCWQYFEMPIDTSPLMAFNTLYLNHQFAKLIDFHTE